MIDCQIFFKKLRVKLIFFEEFEILKDLNIFVPPFLKM